MIASVLVWSRVDLEVIALFRQHLVTSSDKTGELPCGPDGLL